MENKELLDLYSDELISSFGLTTGTGMAEMLGGSISHDRISRFLSRRDFTAADLWQLVKPQVRAIQPADGFMMVDDSMAEKPDTDETEIVGWHYDHAQDRPVKGMNVLSALYPVPAVSLPVGFRVVAKTEYYTDKKDGKTKRRSSVSKNEHDQALLRQAKPNQIPFRFVLNDVWYAWADHRMLVKHEVEADFVMPLKAKRKLALSPEAKQQGRYVRVDSLTLEAGVVRRVYREGVDFRLALVKQVFANQEGSRGIQYLVCSDTHLTGDQIVTSYRKRWNVEPFHNSLKQHASLEKSPTQTVRTQTNHRFAAFCGYIKLELLKVSTHLNHFALKSKLYLRALQVAFEAFRQLQPLHRSA
jgi:hypothetical protein